MKWIVIQIIFQWIKSNYTALASIYKSIYILK